MRSWPNEIGGNEFSLAPLDPEVPQTLKVNTWSNAFELGGKVSIDGLDADGKRTGATFGSITIEESRTVTNERDHLQDLVDEFNGDLAENWRSMIVAARAYVAAHYAKQAVEYAQKSADAAAGIFA